MEQNHSEFNEYLGALLYENLLKEASSMPVDVATYGPLILPLLKKIYPESLVEQIASVQPTKSPVAKIAALFTTYTGDNSNNNNNIHLDNSRLITVTSAAGSAFAVGTQYVTGTGVSGTVFYKEDSQEYLSTIVASSGEVVSGGFPTKYTHLLVRIDTPQVSAGSSFGQTFYTEQILAGDTFGGETVLYATKNRNTIKRVFKDYSTVLEDNTNLKEVSFQLKTSICETVSRKIRSKLTQEKLQDIKALYDAKAYDLVAEAVANEIRQEIDREIIDYIKHIATPMPIDIQLDLSVANNASGNLSDITYDAYLSIFQMIEEIVKATKRNRTMFVLADSTTAGFLAVNVLHTSVEPKDSNPYRVGRIGAYPLFSDPYSTEHYIIVGYKYDKASAQADDAGLFFAPYTSAVIETTDGNAPFTQNFLTINRFAYTRHPQDSGVGMGDSDFFRYVAIDYKQGTNAIQNFGMQIRDSF